MKVSNAKSTLYVIGDGGQPVPAESPRRRVAITLAVLGVCAFVFSLFPFPRTFLWDEAVYLATAENMFSATPYYSELDFRPPLLSVLLFLGSQVMPIETFARLLAAGFFSGGVLLLLLLGNRLYGYVEGLSAAILMLVSPFFLFWAHRVMADIPSTVLTLASVSLVFAHQQDRERKSVTVFSAGVLLTAAVLMRWVCGLAGICALYFVVTRQWRLRSALWYGAGIFAGLAPYLTWAQITQGSFFRPFWTAFVVVERGSEVVLGRLYYLEGVYQIAGPITIVGLCLYLYLLRRDRSGWMRRDFPIVLWFLVFLLYLSTMTHKEVRYAMPAIPALYLLAGRGFSQLRDQRIAGVTALALPLAALYMLGNLSYFRGYESWIRIMLDYSAETRDAGVFIREKGPPNALVYANHLWPVVAYHSKHKTIALWPRDDRFYRSYPKSMPLDGYFLHFRGVEKKPDQEWLNLRPEFRKLREFRNIVLYSYKSPGDKVVDPTFETRLAEARSEFSRGAYDTVIDILAPIRIPDPDVGDLRGWSYYRMGKINEASEAFRQGLLAEPSNPRCLTGLGYAELRLGLPELARDHFQAAVQQIPDKTDALVGLGIAHLRLGDKPAAAEVLRRAQALSPASEEIKEYLKQAEAP